MFDLLKTIVFTGVFKFLQKKFDTDFYRVNLQSSTASNTKKRRAVVRSKCFSTFVAEILSGLRIFAVRPQSVTRKPFLDWRKNAGKS